MTGIKFVTMAAAFVVAFSGAAPLGPPQAVDSVSICKVECSGNSFCEFAQYIFC